MSAVSGIVVETWNDYPFSQFVTALLNSGVYWNSKHPDAKKVCVFEFYNDSIDMGDTHSCPLSEQAQLLADLDTRSQSGTTVVVWLSFPWNDKEMSVGVRKTGPTTFDFFIDSFPHFAGTWLTDFTCYATCLIVPLVKRNVPIRDVHYENGY